MDERVELANKISEDMISISGMTDFSILGDLIYDYSQLLNNTIENFYEIETMGGEAPLFQLHYYLYHGKDNFGYTDEEFEAELEKLYDLVDERFGVDFRDLDVVDSHWLKQKD